MPSAERWTMYSRVSDVCAMFLSPVSWEYHIVWCVATVDFMFCVFRCSTSRCFRDHRTVRFCLGLRIVWNDVLCSFFSVASILRPSSWPGPLMWRNTLKDFYLSRHQIIDWNDYKKDGFKWQEQLHRLSIFEMASYITATFSNPLRSVWGKGKDEAESKEELAIFLWKVPLCTNSSNCFFLLLSNAVWSVRFLYLENGSHTFLRNAGIHLPSYTT
jgi:hypothetical protein